MTDKSARQNSSLRPLPDHADWFERLFTASPGSMALCDTAGNLIDINDACLSMFGVDNKQALEHFRFFDTFPVPESAQAQLTSGRTATYESTLDADRMREKNPIFTTRSGVISLSITVVPVLSGSDPVCRASLVHVQETTEQKQAGEAMIQLRNKLTLVGSVTRHDVLNQLTAIVGYNELLGMMVQDPKLKAFLEKERGAIDKIRRQFQFAKDYQNIGAEPPRWLVLKNVVHRAGETIDITTVRIVDLTGPVSVFADPSFEKVFNNLFDNVIRHGGNASEIRISVHEEDPGMVLVVEDNGCGVPMDEKSKIFERGYGKNTGWGLFLVREILAVTRMTITETGTPGKSARFEIHLSPDTFRTG